MTLQDRAHAYAHRFAKFPASWLRVVQEQGREVLYGVWVTGNDYRNRSAYYGAYPHGVLERLLALFPDIVTPQAPDELPLFASLMRSRPRNAKAPAPAILHAFSGSLPPGPYLRCDLIQDAELRCSVYGLPTATPLRFRLVVADPPYSKADATRYGTAPVDRRRALAALAAVTIPGGYCAWLDTCWPMHNKRQWVTIGRILVQRSTNHRARVWSLFERVA